MNYLDSSAVIDFLDSEAKDHDAARSAIEESPTQTWGTPTVVLYEIYRRRAKVAGPDDVDELAGQLEWVEPIEFTADAAREAALIRAELLSAGNMINEMGILIAGAARAAEAPVFTRDSDFEDVDGLETIRYIPLE